MFKYDGGINIYWLPLAVQPSPRTGIQLFIHISTSSAGEILPKGLPVALHITTKANDNKTVIIKRPRQIIQRNT
jgi:hypothetical protein